MRIRILAAAVVCTSIVAAGQPPSPRQTGAEQTAPPQRGVFDVHDTRTTPPPTAVPAKPAITRPATASRIRPKSKVIPGPVPDLPTGADIRTIALRYGILMTPLNGVEREVHEDAVFQTGDSFRLRITSNFDGYLYGFQWLQTKINLLFPIPEHPGANRVYKNTQVMLPIGGNGESLPIYMCPPAVEETLFLAASEAPIPEFENSVKDGLIRPEMFGGVQSGTVPSFRSIADPFADPTPQNRVLVTDPNPVAKHDFNGEDLAAVQVLKGETNLQFFSKALAGVYLWKIPLVHREVRRPSRCDELLRRGAWR